VDRIHTTHSLQDSKEKESKADQDYAVKIISMDTYYYLSIT